mgnify:CR=1 FL=1
MQTLRARLQALIEIFDLIDAAYKQAVYASGGLTLWQHQANGSHFLIRLEMASRMNAEGDLTIALVADGKVLRGAETCQALRTRQPLQLDPAAMAVPMEKYYELNAAAAKISPVHPATNPPTWYQQLDREALYGMYTGKAPAVDARRSEGGFYPNLDNQYIRTILNRKLGKVFVVRGRAPTTPRTFNGDAAMGVGDLRYWSFCSNQGFANTRVNACVHDERVPVGPDGYYTIVVSRAADRPRNAIPECGVAWLPMADRKSVV